MDKIQLNVHDAKRFSCQMQKALTPLDDDHDARKSAILAFKKSPVVTQLVMLLKDAMVDHGSRLFAPLTVGINKHFSLPVQSGFFKAKQTEQLQAIIDWASQFSDSVIFSQAAKWACECGDRLLHYQTSFLHHFVALAGCVASCTLLERAAVSATTLKDKFLCKVKVGTLTSLRSASANLKAFSTAEVQANLISKDARTDLMHCKALDDWCEVNDVHQELVAAVDVLQEGYAATWQASMRSVAQALRDCCPAWQHARDTLLSNKDLIDQLCANVTKHYSKIGPLASELKEQVKLAKAVHADGHGQVLSKISDARSDFLKDMGDVISFGVDTVGYTYLVYTIVNDLVPERDLQKRITKIGALKTKLCVHHKVKLTDQMAHVLDELAVGARPTCLAVTWKDGEAPQEESQPFGAAAPASDIAEQDRHSEGDAAPKRRRLSDGVKAMAMAACFHK